MQQSNVKSSFYPAKDEFDHFIASLPTNPDALSFSQKNDLSLKAWELLNSGIPMSPTIRKAAAYALGQIGDSATVAALVSRLNIERAAGVREAIIAAISAINLAPDPEYSQLDRRKIIEDVYYGRRPAQLSSWNSN